MDIAIKPGNLQVQINNRYIRYNTLKNTIPQVKIRIKLIVVCIINSDDTHEKKTSFGIKRNKITLNSPGEQVDITRSCKRNFLGHVTTSHTVTMFPARSVKKIH